MKMRGMRRRLRAVRLTRAKAVSKRRVSFIVAHYSVVDRSRRGAMKHAFLFDGLVLYSPSTVLFVMPTFKSV